MEILLSSQKSSLVLDLATLSVSLTCCLLNYRFWPVLTDCAILLLFALVVRFLDIYQVTQALSTVLTNQKQLADMRRSWQNIDFESVRNQSALVCNCRHEDLVQLLEVDFVGLLNSLQKSTEPVGEVMAWADNCCERLMGGHRSVGMSGVEERSTLSSRSILIRWGYVTSQIMRDLVSTFRFIRLVFGFEVVAKQRCALIDHS